MQISRSSMPLCPADQHCSWWARKYMKYCLCSMKDGFSLSLGVISVISWGLAEIPQIMTNYREKSTEGLSFVFLLTWIVGDLLNLLGCMMEPATLPTQYYTAMLYTMTTMFLGGQAIYYGHIYPHLKQRQDYKGPKPKETKWIEKARSRINDIRFKKETGDDGSRNGLNNSSSPIPLPVHPAGANESPGRVLYYLSARSLSSSHTPPSGSFFARMSPTTFHVRNSIQDPLLPGGTGESPPVPHNKNLLCLVSSITLFCTFNLLQLTKASGKSNGIVIKVGRKLLQGYGGDRLDHAPAEYGGIGTYLGWGMAAIYMGGRVPQIFLNMKRGHVDGLNPLMFLFALVGNATYVASILVSSVEWSKIKPNLPWLVDAGGCVLLDLFIIAQTIYFFYTRKHKAEDESEESPSR